MLLKIIESPDLIELGDKIRVRRKQLGLSQAQLAEKTDLSNNTVSRLESAQVKLSVENFFLVADALGVTPNDISPTRFQASNAKPSLSQFDGKYGLLSEENRNLIVASINAMIDGLLLSQKQ